MPTSAARTSQGTEIGKEDSALSVFHVIDKLTVGPVATGKNNLTAPYVVSRDGKTSEETLSYRYEEDVFDPTDPASLNLASLIAAQVALNYGLFCKEIEFRGYFDSTDQSLIREMLANTAREIYVKKILQPNVFLTSDFVGLPPVRCSNYVGSRVTFEPSEPGPIDGWQGDPDRYSVLSSGGKDSLLSFGLIRELDCEVHPIFINESGRHWFTAVNAFREFQRTVPNTARVWTNSDRIFNWMLRHLSMVRPDFQRLRSDEYPIRLWTVAVFLFGALPLLRKRGIGRLLIGDEYDTTVRASYRGIAHFDGLYDQSRYFDHALSRFYAAKGWGLSQLSVLRPMSEMLIQKTLAERYPSLLELQVSCHAAHEEDGRMRPCGNCEKCRRIAGMLLAYGLDPALCGYRSDQVIRIQRDLVEKGVHQERAAVQHMGALLYEKGLISEPRLGKIQAGRSQEPMMLRFHPKRSPVNEVPLAVRKRLHQILLSHSEGSLRRHGKEWVPLDLLGDLEINAPYPFDKAASRPRSGADANLPNGRTSSHEWSKLSWPEAKAALRGVDIALLPVGAIEQHGPHLPLDTDAFDAEYLAHEVAKACKVPRPLVLPLIPYGVSYHHDDFPGTLSISNDALAKFVYDVGMSTARNGVAKLIIINGHGGNSATLHFAAQMINRDARIFTCVDSGESSDPDIFKLAETKNDVHAGEIETSTTLAVRPELVKMKKAKAMVPKFSSHYLDFTSKYSVGWYARTEHISRSGVFGDPTRASAEKGRAIWKVQIQHLVSLVEHLKELSLAEIHQQKV
jgi:creatinine amidohydrolase/Fe(II)-dependent formamide hydrolase-like protein